MLVGCGAGLRIREAKSRRSAEEGQDAFSLADDAVAASQPMMRIG
jgi:hypothetical protein